MSFQLVHAPKDGFPTRAKTANESQLKKKGTSWKLVLHPMRLQFAAIALTVLTNLLSAIAAEQPAAEKILPIDPPEKGFYAKRLDYEGIPIKAHKDVSDEALVQAKTRLAMMLGNLPSAREKLRKAGAELHIIGRNQVTSDLPEHRHLKGKPFEGKLTVDERTRGLGGLLTSCGEENLLRLKDDRYRGRDICVHEFAHNIFQHGMPRAVREKFRKQRERSLAAGLWVDSYAGKQRPRVFRRTLDVVLRHARRPAHARQETGQRPRRPAGLRPRRLRADGRFL